MPSLKRNILYSSVITVSNYLFPLITYPYVSRVLGVTNIGICNYIDGIINYFSLFSMLGIGIIGIREIAGCDDRSRDKVFSSILVLNIITSIIVAAILIVFALFAPKMHAYQDLLLIGLLKLFGNVFMIDWFYKGIENFKYITIRTLTIKILYVIAIFVFIHDSSDYKVYFFLTVLMIVVNAVINILYSNKLVGFTFKDLTIVKYVKPVALVGLYGIFTSMYTSFNVAFLGYVTNPEQVGYYTTATKLFGVIIAFYSSFTGVMLPRMSSLLAENKIDKFKQMMNKSIALLMTFSIPSIIFTTIYAPEMILLFSGTGYEGAYLPARIVMPMIFVLGLEQVFVVQVMMPLKMDHQLLRNSILGAMVGVSMNLLLVPYWGAIGSSIVWALAEMTILILSFMSVTKALGTFFKYDNLFKSIICYVPLTILVVIIYKLEIVPMAAKIVISLFLVGFYCLMTEVYVLRNEMAVMLVKNWKSKLSNM